MKLTSIIAAVSLSLVASSLALQAARAEMYKTDKNLVVITGLTPKSSHLIQTTNAKGKTKTRKPVAANTCGELLISNGANYPTLLVDTETITPSTLPIKTHNRCKARKVTQKATTIPTTTKIITLPPSTPGK